MRAAVLSNWNCAVDGSIRAISRGTIDVDLVASFLIRCLGIVILPARWLKSRASISQNVKSTSDLSQTSDPLSLLHLLGNAYERADHGSDKTMSGVNAVRPISWPAEFVIKKLKSDSSDPRGYELA